MPYDADAVLIIDGQFIPHEFPIIIDGVSLVPIRAVSENLGGEAVWSESQEKITIEKDDTIIELFVGNDQGKINGK